MYHAGLTFRALCSAGPDDLGNAEQLQEIMDFYLEDANRNCGDLCGALH